MNILNLPEFEVIDTIQDEKYALNRIGINVSFEDLLKFYNII